MFFDAVAEDPPSTNRLVICNAACLSKQSPSLVKKPIFIVGCPRSGTSLLYQLLRLHPALAWITPVTNRCLARGSGFFFERPGTAHLLETLLQHLPRSLTPSRYRGPYDGSLSVPGVPETSEGYQIWSSYCPNQPHRLTEQHLTPEATRYFRQVVRWHESHFQRPRFVCKRPRHVLRIRYFNAIFPDAHFVHLIRDGRAVAASILKRRRRAGGEAVWWGVQPPDWQTMHTAPPIAQCGLTWEQCCALAQRDAQHVLPDPRYHEIRYEALTETPTSTFQQLLEHLDLPDARAFTHSLTPLLQTLTNRNDQWQSQLSSRQKRQLLDQIGDALRTHGYADPSEGA